MHPHLFHLGSLTIPTYGVLAAAGLVLALLLAMRNARVAGLDEDAVWNVCLTAIVGTLLISRIVLVTQSWRAFRMYPLIVLTLPTVTRFGLVVSVGCGMAYAAWRRLPLRVLGDVLAPAAMLLAAALHVGDFFAGDDVGVATMSFWGRILPGMSGVGVSAGIGSHPVALYAAIVSLAICGAGVMWLHRSRFSGEVLGGTLVLAAATRFLLDFVRPAPIEAVPTAAGLRIDQWLLLAIVATGGALLLRWKESNHAV